MQAYIYDLETFFDTFLFVGRFTGADKCDVFEISNRRDDSSLMSNHLYTLQTNQIEMVGYNSVNFDYPIIHQFMTDYYNFDARRGYDIGQEIIKSNSYFNRYNVKPSERLIPQIDLVKLNHFDNKAKRTRLKEIQFAMRSHTLEDLPYSPHEPLTNEQKDKLIEYGIHDVIKTDEFYQRCKHAIDMRKELRDTGVLFGDVLNFSDVKIGTEYFVNKLGRANCYDGRKPKSTPRDKIIYKDIILPKIYFRTEPFQEALEWFKSSVHYIHDKDKPCPSNHFNLGGLEFHYGAGGVHASVESKVFKSNDEYVIIDVDVTSMYPSIAIANNFRPHHLGESFNYTYKQLKSDRGQYKKGTPMNAMLKLALNGVYGQSNNQYSPFYDHQFMSSITINGQLQLTQLAEVLSLIPGVKLIQCNTDGVTSYVPKKYEYLFNLWCREWEHETGLDLEFVKYEGMWIRDCNNYIAKTVDGKVKRKGAYWFPESDADYDGWWHKNFSMMIVQKAVNAWMVDGVNPEAYLYCHNDMFDFMKRYKAQGSAKVYAGDQEVTKTVRYFVAHNGQPMQKIASPKGEIGQYKRKNKLTDGFFNSVMKEIGPNVWDERIHTRNKSVYKEVVTSIESGWLVKECNNVQNFNWNDVNYDYYLEEIKKLYIGDQV